MPPEVAVRRSALVAAAIVAALLFFYLMSTAPPQPQATDPGANRSVPRPVSKGLSTPAALPEPVHPPPPEPPDRGANGMPVEIEPGRELRRQALPDRDPQPPADAATWEKRRLDAQQYWGDETYRIAGLWLAGRPEEDRRAVLGALSRFTTAVNANRARIATGAMRPAQAREELKTLKEDVDREVRAVLGDDADALRAHLAEHLLGGGW